MNYLNQKSCKKLFIFIAMVFTLSTTHAKTPINDTILKDTLPHIFPKTGDRSIAISAQPILSYIGNMFNGTENNRLNIDNFGLIYRKYKDNNVAQRYRAALAFSSSESFRYTPSNDFTDYNTRTNRINFEVGYGKEKRYLFKKWALFTGWELSGGYSHTSKSYHHKYVDGDFVNTQFTYSSRYRQTDIRNNLSLAISGIVGAEYYFSKRFFTNVSFSLPLVFNLNIITPDQSESYEITSNNILRVTADEKGSSTYLKNVSFSSSNYASLTIGIVF